MTRRSSPAALLALLLAFVLGVGLHGVASQDPCSGVDCLKPSCETSDSNPTNPPVLGVDACKTCMDNAQASKTPKYEKAWACHSYCQKESLFIDLFVKTNAAADCAACLAAPEVANPWACEFCMAQNPTNITARQACFDCIKRDPYKGLNDTYSNSFVYGCARCSAIKGVNMDNEEIARRNCSICLAAGKLDGGACEYQAKNLLAMLDGLDQPSGIQSQCFTRNLTRTRALSPAQCVDCMNTVINQFPVLPKAYGCAAYCQDTKLVTTAGQAADCKACMTATPLPKDPWACQNCMQNGGTDEQKKWCFACVTNSPTGSGLASVSTVPAILVGNFSNYNWACGQCSTIEDLGMRAVCATCIQNAENETTVCDCVDLIVNQKISTTGDLNAFQRSCYSNWTVDVLLNDNTIDLQIVYGYETNISTIFTGESCVACISAAKATSGDKVDKQYACRQYCQDPTLVINPAQGAACAQCVGHADILDPWACQNCMTVTTTQLPIYTGPGVSATDNLVVPNTGQMTVSVVDQEARQECFDCLLLDPKKFDNYAWGCGQCALMKNETLRRACLLCLFSGCIDPCQCVTNVTQIAQGPSAICSDITPDPQAECTYEEISSDCNATCDGSEAYPTGSIITRKYPVTGNLLLCAVTVTVSRCNTTCAVDCVYDTTATAVTACNKTCGTGYQLMSYDITSEPQNGGAACPADYYAPCNTEICPQDCTVKDEWFFMGCNATCNNLPFPSLIANGTATYKKEVLNQQVNGSINGVFTAGAACPALVEYRPCNQSCATCSTMLAGTVGSCPVKNGRNNSPMDSVWKWKKTAGCTDSEASQKNINCWTHIGSNQGTTGPNPNSKLQPSNNALSCLNKDRGNCSYCHGECCMDDGVCPDSSCPGNDLGTDTSGANCVPVELNSINGIASVERGSCPVGDPSSTVHYYAYCNYNAYGDNICEGSSWKRGTAAKPTSSPGRHCLGRVACRNPENTADVACDPRIAVYEGIDCYSDGNSNNWKICFDCKDCKAYPW